MWVTVWSLESQPFNSWESTTDLQDLQDFLFLFLRHFVCICKSFQVDTRDAILSLNEAPVLFVSWGFQGDVIQRVNRIFTADDNVLAGGALKKSKNPSLHKKRLPFFLVSKVIGAQQGGAEFFEKLECPKSYLFFRCSSGSNTFVWLNLLLECADHKSNKKEKTALDFWNLWHSWIWTYRNWKCIPPSWCIDAFREGFGQVSWTMPFPPNLILNFQNIYSSQLQLSHFADCPLLKHLDRSLPRRCWGCQIHWHLSHVNFFSVGFFLTSRLPCM